MNARRLKSPSHGVPMRVAAGALVLAALAQPSFGFAAAGPQIDADAAFEGAAFDEVPAAAWWETFADPRLIALVVAGLGANLDLAAAEARVAQANALAMAAAAPLWPTLSLDSGAKLAPFSSRGASFGGIPSGPGAAAPNLYYTGSLMLNARLNVDVWGRQTLTRSAARESAEAAQRDRDQVAMRLAHQIGQAYFDAVAAAQQMFVLKEQIERSRAILDVTELRFKRGDATAIDVLQQKQQLAAASAALPTARAQQRVHRQRLAVLIGEDPTGPLPTTAAALPPLPPPPGAGMPADLMDNRPDLRGQRDRLRAHANQSKAAFRSHLPRLAVTGQAGRLYYHAGETRATDVWGAGIELSLPLFSGGANVAAVDEAEAQERAARQSLQQAWLQAVGDVQGALVVESEQIQHVAAVRLQLEAAQQAFDESRARYASGVGAYLSVLMALNALHQSQLAMVQSERNLVGARLDLRQAMGGPWTRGLYRRRGGDGVQEVERARPHPLLPRASPAAKEASSPPSTSERRGGPLSSEARGRS